MHASAADAKENAMKVNTGVKAGGLSRNRCEDLRRGEMTMTVKTAVRAGGAHGGIHVNRCETLQHKGSKK